MLAKSSCQRGDQSRQPHTTCVWGVQKQPQVLLLASLLEKEWESEQKVLERRQSGVLVDGKHRSEVFQLFCEQES